MLSDLEISTSLFEEPVIGLMARLLNGLDIVLSSMKFATSWCDD